MAFLISLCNGNTYSYAQSFGSLPKVSKDLFETKIQNVFHKAFEKSLLFRKVLCCKNCFLASTSRKENIKYNFADSYHFKIKDHYICL